MRFSSLGSETTTFLSRLGSYSLVRPGSHPPNVACVRVPQGLVQW